MNTTTKSREIKNSNNNSKLFGGIPEGWEIRSLGGVSFDISYGYTASASTVPVGPGFLRITDIQGGHVDWNSVPYCKISERDKEKYRLEKGDVCIARTGASTGTWTTPPCQRLHRQCQRISSS